MKVVLQDNRQLMLRFDKGEEVIGGLLEFAKTNNIRSAYFSGIGACDSFELGFFNGFLKNYRHKPFLKNSEIISLTGNVSVLNNEPVIHAHGVFSDSDFEIVGGHVFKIMVSVTCEVFLTAMAGDLNRGLNTDFNLNLLT